MINLVSRDDKCCISQVLFFDPCWKWIISVVYWAFLLHRVSNVSELKWNVVESWNCIKTFSLKKRDRPWAFFVLMIVNCLSAYSLFAAFEYLYVIYGNINFHNGSLSSFSDLNRAQYFAISDKLVLNETVRVTPRRRGSSIDSNESAVSRKNSSAKNPKSTVADSWNWCCWSENS